ncbi:hypothetical protein ACWKWU_03670 [Chitinophaga lutea]
MKKIIALSTILFAFIGCKKSSDLDGNKPKLTFKSASTTDVPADMKLMAFEFTLEDADGDTEAAMYVHDSRMDVEDRYEEVLMPALESHKGIKLKADVSLYVSDLGDNVRMRLRDGFGDPRPNPDTMQYKVFVLDNAGNSSDTITLPKVAIHR